MSSAAFERRSQRPASNVTIKKRNSGGLRKRKSSVDSLFEGSSEMSGVLLKRSRFGVWQRRFFSTKGKYLRYHAKERSDGVVRKKISILSYSKIEASAREVRLQKWSDFEGSWSVVRLRASTAVQAKTWAQFLAKRADACAAGECLLLKKDPYAKDHGELRTPPEKGGGDREDAPTARTSRDEGDFDPRRRRDDDDELSESTSDPFGRRRVVQGGKKKHHLGFLQKGEEPQRPVLKPLTQTAARFVFDAVSDTSGSTSGDDSDADDEPGAFEDDVEEPTTDIRRIEELLMHERVTRGLKARPTPPAFQKPPPAPPAWQQLGTPTAGREIELDRDFEFLESPPEVVDENEPLLAAIAGLSSSESDDDLSTPSDVVHPRRSTFGEEGLDDNETAVGVDPRRSKRRPFDPEVGRRELLAIAEAKRSSEPAPTVSFLTDPSPLGHVWLPHWGAPPKMETNALLAELEGKTTTAKTVVQAFHASPLLLGLTVEYCDDDALLEENRTTLGALLTSVSGCAPVYPDADDQRRRKATGDGDDDTLIVKADAYEEEEKVTADTLNPRRGDDSASYDLVEINPSLLTDPDVVATLRRPIADDATLLLPEHPSPPDTLVAATNARDQCLIS